VPDTVISRAAQPTGLLPADQTISLDVVLPLRDPAGLQSFLSDVFNPASPNYRNFLSVQEFTERFGPTQQDYDAVVRFAQAHGFTVTGGTRDGMEVQIKGPVSAVETAFHLYMRTFQHPAENRTFYAPDQEPTTDLPFDLWHVSGLDNYSIPRPLFVKKSDYAKAHKMAEEDVVPYATTGSGPSASFLGSDMRAAYYGGTALTGAGQNLGLLEYYGTDLADLTSYFKSIGQTNNVPITLLSTDGTSTSCANPSCDDTEQTIDMTQAIGMAPGLASLVVYIGSSDTAIISSMTTHSPLPTTIGCSWGWTPVDPTVLDPYFQRMAAQGQNFFAASGDSSTWSSSVGAWPADDAYVVSVGGTDLVTNGAAGPWQSETAWEYSGGGVSPDNIAIPAWQQLSGVINANNKGSASYRNGPDVSANANFTFYVCADQTTCTANLYGGTSFAAPMWAGYIALVNQQLAANGKPAIGFLNPAIYAQNVTSSYDANFHDITSGTSGSYSAITGYDLVTGWGSPKPGLISALATPSAGTSTAVTASVNPTVYGQTVTFTATVSSTTAGTITGTVSFKDGATVLGSGTVDDGKATLSTSVLAAGSQSITAVYSGNTSYGSSASAALAQTVKKAGTTTVLASSLNPAVFGESVTFTATVSAIAPGGGTSSGTVTFKNGATTLSTVTLSGGKATYATTSLPIGSHAISASYAGSTDDTASTSSTLTQVVRAGTSTAVTASVNPTVYGQTVTFTATVSSTTAGTITGTVSFKDGATVLGSGTVSGGKATLSTSVLAAGSQSITAVYSGNTSYGSSASAALAHTVNKARTTAKLTSSLNPSTVGKSVTFKATIAATAPGTGTPTGTVTFKDGATTLGSVALDSGIASYTTTKLAHASHSITAVYSGSKDNLVATSAVLTQKVD
jgi:kumamolisin